MWLTRLALRNPVLILMMSLMVIVLGGVSVSRLSVDLFPDITIPVIRVATFYAGAGPADIEKTITQPIERAVARFAGRRSRREHVEAGRLAGQRLVQLRHQPRQRAVRGLAARGADPEHAAARHPAAVHPQVRHHEHPGRRRSPSRGEGLDEKQLYDLAYNTIEPQLERIPGVASATVGGGKTREIDGQGRPRRAARARARHRWIVVSAVRSSNLLLPSGNLRAGDPRLQRLHQHPGRQARPLARSSCGRARRRRAQQRHRCACRDVAAVEDGAADQNEIVRVNGARGVYLRVLKQPGANTIARGRRRARARSPTCAASRRT